MLKRLTRYISGRKGLQYETLLPLKQVQAYLALIAPGLVLYYWAKMADIIRNDIIETLFNLFIHIVILAVLERSGSSVQAIYNLHPIAEKRPIKGYVQFSKLMIYIVGIVVSVAILSGKSPWKIVTGLGAMAAIVMLIFKNTVLSFVASLQLLSDDTLRLGDCVAVSGTDANGTITDISLHSVKVQNFDNTVVSIPTHLLMDTPTKNWRGMVESGVRRIECAVFIDQNSIRFCDDSLLEKFQGLPLMADYIRQLKSEKAGAPQGALDEYPAVDDRNGNNLRIFRAYVADYLGRHPRIRQDMIRRVRTLDPTPTGIPIQIQAFADTVVSTEFDAIQADIFEHLIFMIREFGLRVYQRPSGG